MIDKVRKSGNSEYINKVLKSQISSVSIQRFSSYYGPIYEQTDLARHILPTSRSDRTTNEWYCTTIISNYIFYVVNIRPITVEARSTAWINFSRSNAGIVGSNRTGGMDICPLLFSVCVVLCVGSGLVAGWSPVQWVLSNMYRLKKIKKRER
jgi:hypothetical protein